MIRLLELLKIQSEVISGLLQIINDYGGHIEKASQSRINVIIRRNSECSNLIDILLHDISKIEKSNAKART
jgi:hypothetical protein